jgi:peptidoglycan/xylan/chitin deacetylase (PgdA/CDA1 family)
MPLRKRLSFSILLHKLGFTRIRLLFFRLRGKPITRILAFHDIPGDSELDFEAKMHALSETTNVLSLDDFLSGTLAVNRVNVVITFDDGYQSWVRVAAPILKKLGLPATFFISSSFVGLEESEEAEFVSSRLRRSASTTGGLSTRDVRWLADEGFTIGGHTCSHIALGELEDESEVLLEIREDRHRLRLLTGRNVDFFAYPFGIYENSKLDLASLLKEAGIKAAVTTQPGFNTCETDPYRLKRDLTGRPTSLGSFNARVRGAYDLGRFLRARFQAILKRVSVPPSSS